MESRNSALPLQSTWHLEKLEDRRLLSHGFGPTAQLVGQDLAVSQFPSINGSGESIAVLDTGIDYNDPLLGGGFGPHHKVVAGYDFVNNDGNPIDPDGHGTGVAGIIGADPFTLGKHSYQGIAPGANLIALRIDNSVTNPTADIINSALQWVLVHQARYNIVAVNLSEGGNSTYPQKLTGANTTLLQELQNAGVFVAVAAGNDSSTNGIEYPGADPYAVSVSSVDTDDQVSSFADVGQDLNLLAPGSNVPTTYTDNVTGAPVVLDATGTSFATPFAAAAAALVHQADPALSPTSILAILQQTGQPIFDAASGGTYFRINIDNALIKATRLSHQARHAHSMHADAAEQVNPEAALPTAPVSMFSQASMGWATTSDLILSGALSSDPLGV
jgi:subtilisin family serine protease